MFIISCIMYREAVYLVELYDDMIWMKLGGMFAFEMMTSWYNFGVDSVLDPDTEIWGRLIYHCEFGPKWRLAIYLNKLCLWMYLYDTWLDECGSRTIWLDIEETDPDLVQFSNVALRKGGIERSRWYVGEWYASWDVQHGRTIWLDFGQAPNIRIHIQSRLRM